MKHACANNLVERLAELFNPLDRKPVELQVSYVMLRSKVAGMTQTRFADVDCGYARLRLHHGVAGCLRRSAPGDQNFPVGARLLQRPEQQILRPAAARIAIEIKAPLEAADWRRIGMRLIKG